MPAQALKPSAALSIIANAKPTLQGRCIGLLVDDGSDARVVAALRSAVQREQARVKIVAPKIGGATLSDGKQLAADGQLAGTPSLLFDAVAIVLSDSAAARLSKEAAARAFVTDAWNHLKAIAVNEEAKALLQACGVDPDEGVVEAADTKGFVAAAATRQWQREACVHALP